MDAASHQVDQLTAQLAGRERRGVNDGAGAVADWLEQRALALNGILHRATVAHERVESARLLIALDDDLGRGFNKQN